MKQPCPNFGGKKSKFASKSPPKLGDLGGLDVANETSQTTSQLLEKLIRIT